MKKIIVFLLMCMLFTIGSAAGKKRTTDKEYKGQYIKSTNTFTYKKDNLVFPDKTLTYELKDNSGLLNGIYEFIGQTYGVTDDDIIGLNVVGRVSGNTFIVTKITNYRIPEEKLNNAVSTGTPALENIGTESQDTEQ